MKSVLATALYGTMPGVIQIGCECVGFSVGISIARRAFPIGGMCGFDFHGIRYYSDVVGINTTLAGPVRNFRLSVVRGWRAGIGTVVGKYSKNNSFCRICRYFPDGFHAGSREGKGMGFGRRVGGRSARKISERDIFS